MERIHVTPAEGMPIRNPEDRANGAFGRLPPDGAWVEPAEYWARHIRDGAVRQTGGPHYVDGPAE